MGWGLNREHKTKIVKYERETPEKNLEDTPCWDDALEACDEDRPHLFLRINQPIYNAYAVCVDGCSYFRSKAMGDYMPPPSKAAEALLAYIDTKFPQVDTVSIAFDNYACIPDRRKHTVHTTRYSSAEPLPEDVVDTMTTTYIDSNYTADQYMQCKAAKMKYWRLLSKQFELLLAMRLDRKYILQPPNLLEDDMPEPVLFNMNEEETQAWKEYVGRKWGEGDFIMMLTAMRLLYHPDCVASGNTVYCLTGDWDVIFSLALAPHPQLAVFFNRSVFVFRFGTDQKICFDPKTVNKELTKHQINPTKHFQEKYTTRYNEIIQCDRLSRFPWNKRLHMVWWYIHAGCDYFVGSAISKLTGFRPKISTQYCYIDHKDLYSDFLELFHTEKGERALKFYQYRYLNEIFRAVSTEKRRPKQTTMNEWVDEILNVVWTLLYYLLWRGNASISQPLYYQSEPSEIAKAFKCNLYKAVCVNTTPECKTNCHCKITDVEDHWAFEPLTQKILDKHIVFPETKPIDHTSFPEALSRSFHFIP